jgi:hypothetical protein
MSLSKGAGECVTPSFPRRQPNTSVWTKGHNCLRVHSGCPVPSTGLSREEWRWRVRVLKVTDLNWNLS